MKVVGCDPGGRDTGILLRSRGDVEAVEIVHLPDGDPRPTHAYLNRVLDTIAELRDLGRSPTGRVPIVAVEDLTKPTGFRKGARPGQSSSINPEHLIGVAMVLAVVIATFDAVVVPNSGNGSHILRAYPPSIIGGPHNERWPRPEPKGAGILRHARSAYDVAGLALARRTEARRPA